MFFILNCTETSVFTKIWITSNSFFSRGVSLRAKVSISSSKTIFRLLTCYKFFLVSLFVPLLLKCSAETVLNNKTLSAIVNSQNFFLEIHQCVTNPTFFSALFENVLLLFTWVQYDKTQTPFFSALSPETRDQIKLVKYKIGFES